jgi:hypothetical protein
LNHQDRRLLALQMQDDMANYLDEVLHLDHLHRLVVLQNLDALNLDAHPPSLDEHLLGLDVLLGATDVVLEDVALVDVESHQLRMDYFRHVVDVADLLRHLLMLLEEKKLLVPAVLALLLD